ncbi:hypothetical protein [Burkholderia pseudomallei]|uniref:hypothetical protein n=1 Tax=Burkholderia pseudomallei TaxID=28450 RepID=UPI002741A8DE|nr:hypothetical protein [Burkholderia pseudomallei]
MPPDAKVWRGAPVLHLSEHRGAGFRRFRAARGHRCACRRVRRQAARTRAPTFNATAAGERWRSPIRSASACAFASATLSRPARRAPLRDDDNAAILAAFIFLQSFHRHMIRGLAARGGIGRGRGRRRDGDNSQRKAHEANH